MEALSAIGALGGGSLDRLGSAARTGSTDEGGFGAALSGALSSVSETGRAAGDLVAALAAGEDVQLSDVAVATTEAALAVELLVTVRDQAVQAYQQIANLQL